MRGQGRDDYPVRAMWNAVLAGVVFQHPSLESLIRELGRNAALLQDCGFSPLPLQKKPLSRVVRDELSGRMRVEHEAAQEAIAAIPGSWNFSRFLANVIELEETPGLVTGMIATLRRQLMDELPDFERHLGYDGKAIDSHSTGRVNRASGETSDPDADWGKHETAGVDARTGKPRKKIKSWFGYYAIRPLIDTRELWREEKQHPDYDPSKPITRPLYPERADTIVYTEKGSMHCICPQTGEQRDLAFQGFESDRNTIEYRCPAAAYGLECEGRAQCHQAGEVNPGDYGRIVRICLEDHDRRIFVPTPHGSPGWQRGYNRRNALERINNRIDNSFGFERHFIRGLAKMQTRVGLALAVMTAMALGHVKPGRIEQMRSLVQPIPIPATG
jgi:hypothetical protein